ncbi:SpaA isopeptide-forming pilin-related protein [Pseudoscardovia radai]|uniref:SpaA isopeptide-forming pilin-related protein n=1 Tax=Pseudoscardovia radai TaxID=987066 RepID=UPI0039923236
MRENTGRSARHAGAGSKRWISWVAASVTLAMVAGSLGAFALTGRSQAQPVTPSGAPASISDVVAGAKATSTDITMSTGSDGTATVKDTGIATWVGGNMNIGTAVAGSYAAEAEGVTAVAGNLTTNQIKNSWKDYGYGFRWGRVGFGTQFRPADDSTVLAVGGNVTKAGGHHTFLVENGYDARIAGSETYDSVVSKGMGNDVTWNYNDPLSAVPIGGSTVDLTKDGFFTPDVVNSISTPLSQRTATGTVTVGEANNDSVVRNYFDSTQDYTYRFCYAANTDVNCSSASRTDTYTALGLGKTGTYKNLEKLITLTSTDTTSSVVVFNLTSDQLSDTYNGVQYRGVAFDFENIQPGQRVVVNVEGETVSFHTGWKFYWNGTEIGNGYSSLADSDVRSAYVTAAQSILWNFYDASSVTIGGGVARAGLDKSTEDDPSAAMLGSIVVPEGSLDSHVTTNGRVYVGGDFSMDNPYAVHAVNADGSLGGVVGMDTFYEGPTSSVINMDQERHNFPWTAGSSVSWNKTDTTGKPLGNSTWAVYGTYDDAVNGTNALVTVTDNDSTDIDPTTGSISVDGLKSGSDYYLKETSVLSGYIPNNTVYWTRITAGTVSAAFAYSVTKSSSGSFTYDDGIGLYKSDDGTVSVANMPVKATWAKTTADGATPLAGSAWIITRHDGTTNTDATACVSDNNAVSQTGCAVTLTDTDATEGTVTVSGDDASGDGFLVYGADRYTYTVTESVAPTGYYRSATPFSLSFDGTSYVVAQAVADSPISVTWKKTASDTGTALAGSVWKITRTGSNNSTATACVSDNNVSYTVDGCNAGSATLLNDADSTDGTITVSGTDAATNGFLLSDTESTTYTYTLAEVLAPNGYAVASQSRTFTIDSSTLVVNADGTKTADTDAGAIVDQQVTMAWSKISGSDHLPDSAWLVKRTSPTGTTAYACVSDNVSGSSQSLASLTACQSAAGTGAAVTQLTDTNTESGKFTVADRTGFLLDGAMGYSYQLIEVVAPNGYMLDSTPLSLTYASNTALYYRGDGGKDTPISNTPIGVNWTKEDTNFKPLAGAAWKVERYATATATTPDATGCVGDTSSQGTASYAGVAACSTATALTDGNTADGIVSLSGDFLISGAHYEITEVVAPTGFQINPATYVLAVTTDSDGKLVSTLTLKTTGETVDGNVIQDQPNTLEWKKADASGAALQGSVWQVTRSGSDGSTATACVGDNGASVPGTCTTTLTDVDVTAGSIQLSGSNSADQAFLLGSTETVTYTYSIKELVPPTGYTLDTADHVVTLNAAAKNIPILTVTDAPVVASWQKVGADGATLLPAGSVWEVVRTGTDGTDSSTANACVVDNNDAARLPSGCSGKTTLVDTNTTAGIIELRGDNTDDQAFLLGDTSSVTYSYEIAELVAPDGYSGASIHGTYMPLAADSTGTLTRAAVTNSPVTATWKKTDSVGGNALSGSVWKITRTDTDTATSTSTTATACVSDDNADISDLTACSGATVLTDTQATTAGTISISGAADASSAAFLLGDANGTTRTYTLTEVKAPTGHYLDTTERAMTLDPATGTLSIANATAGSDGIATIPNTPLAAQWEKTDSVTGAAIAGSVWRLVRTATSTADQSQTQTIACVSDNNAALTGVTACDGAETLNDIDTTDGTIQLSGGEASSTSFFLSDDADATYTYTLTEVKAPAGYYLDATTRTMTLDKTTGALLIDGAGTASDGLPALTNTPIAFSWTKRSAAGTALAGSVWTVTDTTTSQTRCIGDAGVTSIPECGTNALLTNTGTGTGAFTVDGSQVANADFLVEGHSYKLVEIKAPDGYFRSATTGTASYTMAYDAATKSFAFKAADGTAVAGATVSDAPIKLTWTKADNISDTHTLSGSTWKLQRTGTDGSTVTACVADKNTPIANCEGTTLTNGSATAGVFDISGAASDANAGFLLDNVDSATTYTYTLTEANAPQGYTLDPTVYTIDLATGTVTGTNGNVIVNVLKTGAVSFGKVLVGGASDELYSFQNTVTFGGTEQYRPATYPVTFATVTAGADGSDAKKSSAAIAAYTVAQANGSITVSVDGKTIYTCPDTACAIATDASGKQTVNLLYDAANESFFDKPITMQVAAGYAYTISGLPDNASLTVRESIPDDADFTFMEFRCGTGSGTASCVTDTATNAKNNLSGSIVRLYAFSADPAPAFGVAVNARKDSMPQTGRLGGVWAFAGVGLLLLLGGVAVFRRRGENE